MIHHFGSKDGLRAACDDYVAALIRDRKVEAVEAGADLDPLHVLRNASTDPAVFRYLVRTLTGSSAQVDALVDQLVDNAVEYTRMGIERGIVKPLDNVREVTAVLTIFSLGTVVLHDHLKRLLDVDLIDGGLDDRVR